MCGEIEDLGRRAAVGIRLRWSLRWVCVVTRVGFKGGMTAVGAGLVTRPPQEWSEGQNNEMAGPTIGSWHSVSRWMMCMLRRNVQKITATTASSKNSM